MTHKMNKKMQAALAILLALSSFIRPTEARAALGISTRFVDVVLEHIEVGKIYNLRQLRNIPYTVKNRGSAAMEIAIEVVIPASKEISNGYEAVVDPTWVKVVPNRIRVEAGAVGFAEMIIQVPDDQRYVNRHFQAKVIAKSVDTGMYVVQTESRLRFSTGGGPEALKEERKKMAMMSLDFDVTPDTLFVDGVKPGVKYDLRKETRKTLKVTNRAETPLKMKFTSVPYDSARFPIQGEYEAAPDPSWLKFKQPLKEIAPETIESLDPVFEIPGGDEHRGKKYVFLVKTDIVMGVDLEVFNKIYVKVEEKK